MSAHSEREVEEMAEALYVAYAFDHAPVIGKITPWKSVGPAGRITFIHMANAALATRDRQRAESKAEGFVMAPAEITKEMAHALESNFAKCLPPSEVHRANWAEAYRNMLAVSPNPDKVVKVESLGKAK